MIAQSRFKSVHWMLLAILALGPTAALAQQDNASQGQKQQDQNQPEAAPAKTEEPQKQTEETQAKTGKDAKEISGMSILGNQEAPKSLVIVPWKGSEIGDMPGLSRLLDDAVQPVDKDVFMRELAYYEIRSGKQ